MFGNLPSHEKQAFFSLLDEYFEARPHLLPPSSDNHVSAAYAPSTSAKKSPPPIAPRRSNPSTPAAARTQAPMTPSRNPQAGPAGLTSGKSFGSMKTTSGGAAIGSILQGSKSREPVTPGEAISGLRAVNRAANKFNFSGDQPQKTVAAPPPPPPPPGAASPNSLGQAEVIYEYKGTEAEDLSVRPYDVITLLEKVNDDWWKAESSDGRSGLVPATYVKVL